MKRKILIQAVILLSQTPIVLAQQSPFCADTLTLLNGRVKTGQFITGNLDSIQWKETGKTQTDHISRNEVAGIMFGKRKGDIYLSTELGKIKASTYRVNSVAVLPMEYSGNIKEGMNDDMPYWLQEMASMYLGSSARTLTIADPAEINSVLKKNGITLDDMKRYSPAELASLLQVDYLLTGHVIQEAGNNSTFTHHSDSKEIRVEHTKDNTRIKVKNNGGSFSNSSQDVKTNVLIKLYNHDGNILFSDTRKSILSSGDAYKKCLHYLLKRTPLYKK